MNAEIEKLLGDSAKGLLEHKCKTVPKERLHLPGPDFVDRIFALSDRNPQVMRNMQALFNGGRQSRLS
ncbi:MAG: fructose-bisphosphate aldolase, partial [Verrucomicrobiota bacterium]